MQQNLFSVACSQGSSLHTVNDIYEEDFFGLNIYSADFSWNIGKKKKYSAVEKQLSINLRS